MARLGGRRRTTTLAAALLLAVPAACGGDAPGEDEVPATGALRCVEPPLPAAPTGGPGTLVRHVHASHYVEVPAGETEPDVDRVMAMTDVVTMTEVQDRDRAAVLREAGWQRVWPAGAGRGARNVGISLRRAVWEVVDQGWVRTTPLTFVRAGGATSEAQAAVWALAEHRRTGATLLVSVAHLPPSVTRDGDWNDAVPQRVAVWRDAVAGWVAHTRSVVDAVDPDAVLVTGDWNVDVRQERLRRVLDAAWSPLGLELSFDALPEGHTFDGLGGLGVIDLTYAGGATARVARAGCILTELPSSNHDAVETVLRVPGR